jgi:hypothetical protein
MAGQNVGQMKDDFEKREAEHRQDEAMKGLVENAKKTNIYWAPASRYQIANFVEEKMGDMGRVIQRESPIRFEEHIYVTDRPDEIAFIEKSAAFLNHQVIKCPTMKDASDMSRAQRVAKSVRTIRESFNESTFIQEGE